MPANKNQHFVPRCHLRPFTHEGGGAAINLFNIAKARAVAMAPVKGQCARDHFYGKDLVIEKYLQNVEGRYASILSVMRRDPSLIGPDDLRFLRKFAFIQANRTEMVLKRRRQAMEGMDEISHRGLEHLRTEEPNLSHEHLVAQSIKIALTSERYVDDLRDVILVNKTGMEFVTSDDPAVITNRLYMQKLGGASFGFISPGLQLVLPLGPAHVFVAYDPLAYTLPNRAGIYLEIKRESDVEAVNQLQYLSCNANIYFSSWSQCDEIKQRFWAIAERRPEKWYRYWLGVLEKTDAEGEHYRKAQPEDLSKFGTRIASVSPVYPNPSLWVSEIQMRPKVWGYTNGSAGGYVRVGQAGALHAATKPYRREPVRSSGKASPQGPETALLTHSGRSR